MKNPEYRAAKSFSLYFQVFICCICWYVICVNCLLKRCKCISALCTHTTHHFIIFICNGKRGSHPAYRIYLVINCCAFICIGCFIVLLIKGTYFIQFWFFLYPIQRTIFICSFKQHMLQVVCKSGMICRVCFTAGLGCNITLNTRIFVGWTKDYR